jgi:hypothetical protein
MASRAARTISQPGVNVTGQLAREVACDAGDLVLVSGFEACRALFGLPAHFWNIQLSLSPVGTAATKIVIVLPCATSVPW